MRVGQRRTVGAGEHTLARTSSLLFAPFVFLAIGGCASARVQPALHFKVESLVSNSTSSMRGLSVVDERVVWASGSRGNVLRTTDGGASWTSVSVPGADSLDFRDIEAFDSLTAYVLSAGEDGRIYRTVDGGRSWQLQFRNQVKGAFFDCMDFYDRSTGIAMSDPVDGRYLLVKTTDGSSWRELPAASRPQSMAGEAAFAASGTCLTIAGQHAFLATGGGERARVFRSADRGASWQAVTTPVLAGAPAAGIFALAFRDGDNGLAIGGNYEQHTNEATVAVTADGGTTWHAAGTTSYASGAAWSGDYLIAVGTNGTRVSRDRGMSWLSIDGVEYNAVQFANARLAFAVGPRGRIARIVAR